MKVDHIVMPAHPYHIDLACFYWQLNVRLAHLGSQTHELQKLGGHGLSHEKKIGGAFNRGSARRICQLQVGVLQTARNRRGSTSQMFRRSSEEAALHSEANQERAKWIRI